MYVFYNLALCLPRKLEVLYNLKMTVGHFLMQFGTMTCLMMAIMVQAYSYLAFQEDGEVILSLLARFQAGLANIWIFLKKVFDVIAMRIYLVPFEFGWPDNILQ